MKLKNNFFYTIREDSKEEESKSGNLLVKAGFIKKSSSGIYMLMPLGYKVFKNIENIIREEMNKTGANELLMPALIPEEVYIKSGRRENFGSDMFSLKDRLNRNYVLGPTHEELFVNAASSVIKSYKDMPFNIYQFGTKYRDEPRPRYGLIRVREFVMKDAYSFDKDYDGLDISYSKMFNAYKNIFNRVGLNYKIVTADTGVMGGLLSEEFQAITDIGEDTIVLCETCDFASNIEVCKCLTNKQEETEKEKEKELIHTPNIKTIENLKQNDFQLEKLVKTLIYKIDNNYYACMLPASYEINELKLRKMLNAKEVELASKEEVEKITNAEVGFAGPIDINIPIIIDEDVLLMKNFITGANKTDYHYKNVNISDIKDYQIGEIKLVKENDYCPKCHNKLKFKKGIEVGNTFKLGETYAKKMGLTYLDKDNKEKYPIMGSYGIGLGRILASIAEQKNDENGLIWPIEIAPFKVAIVLLNKEAEAYADSLYENLNNENIETILDNRDERPGVKFKDMDLIGIPIRITIGKKYNEGKVELKLRNKEEIKEINLNDVTEKIKNIIKSQEN